MKAIVLVLIMVTFMLLWCISTLHLFHHDVDLKLSKEICTCYPRVFGIGLPRTGTCSLGSALTSLGFQVRHYPLNYNNNIDDRNMYLSKRNAILDITMLGIDIGQLYNRFPGAYFISTERDKASWLKSMLQLHTTLKNFRDLSPVVYNNFVKQFGNTAKTIELKYRLHMKEVERLETRTLVHRVHLVSRAHTDHGKWKQIADIFNLNPQYLKHTPFPHESHIVYHIKQAWGF